MERWGIQGTIPVEELFRFAGFRDQRTYEWMIQCKRQLVSPLLSSCEPLLALQPEGLAQAPGVHEEHRPAHGERHQDEKQVRRHALEGEARSGDIALLIASGAGLSYAAQVVTVP